MADIELVIKIPEWQYKSICEGVEASKRCGVVGIDPNIHEAIYNGTSLPKGHGDLIDARDYENSIRKYYFDNRAVIRCTEIALANAHTIIEADKENDEI